MSQAPQPPTPRQGRGTSVLRLAAAALIVIGVAKIFHAGQTHAGPAGPPQPPADAAVSNQAAHLAVPVTPTATAATMNYALPVHIDIPDAEIACGGLDLDVVGGQELLIQSVEVRDHV